MKSLSLWVVGGQHKILHSSVIPHPELLRIYSSILNQWNTSAVHCCGQSYRLLLCNIKDHIFPFIETRAIGRGLSCFPDASSLGLNKMDFWMVWEVENAPNLSNSVINVVHKKSLGRKIGFQKNKMSLAVHYKMWAGLATGELNTKRSLGNILLY